MVVSPTDMFREISQGARKLTQTLTDIKKTKLIHLFLHGSLKFLRLVMIQKCYLSGEPKILDSNKLKLHDLMVDVKIRR